MNYDLRTILGSGIITLLLIPFLAAHAQIPDWPIRGIPDPCGYPDTTSAAYIQASINNWGYGYDSLLADLSRWQQSPFVRIDSIGFTVQQRRLYTLTIEDTSRPALPRKRIWIHARTHPNEVQGTWVTNRIIAILLSDLPLARTLRDSCVFTILPMLNPDGVELRQGRENARGIDLESNWSTSPGEPEVQALRNTFAKLMTTPSPIHVALNMHSSVSCTRYFVYHAASGTSTLYANLQQKFIGLVRAQFPGGVQAYSYFVSWVNSAPTYYPESWFWYNYREAVLALTYEDMNCPQAGEFEKTAAALLYGAGEFLGVLSGATSVMASAGLPEAAVLEQNYPNPFNPTTTIEYNIGGVVAMSGVEGRASTSVRLAVYDILGREVAVLVNDWKPAGSYTVRFNASGLPSGVYLYRLNAGSFTTTRKMLLVE